MESEHFICSLFFLEKIQDFQKKISHFEYNFFSNKSTAPCEFVCVFEISGLEARDFPRPFKGSRENLMDDLGHMKK